MKASFQRPLFRLPALLSLFSKYCLVVSLELQDTCIGKRMLGHLLDYGVRNGCDVCTCKCAIGYMDGITNACCDDLGIDTSNVEDLSDLTNQIHTSLADVIKTAKERRYIGST